MLRSYKEYRDEAGSRREAIERYAWDLSQRFPGPESGLDLKKGRVCVRLDWDVILGHKFSGIGLLLMVLSGGLGVPAVVESMRVSTYHSITGSRVWGYRLRMWGGKGLGALGYLLLFAGVAATAGSAAFVIFDPYEDYAQGSWFILYSSIATVVAAPLVRRLGFLVRVPGPLRWMVRSPFLLTGLGRG